MRNQQDRKISVQVFDRYTEPHLQGDKRESKRDQCYVLPQVTTSEFSYRDEIPTPISLRVKDLLESNIGGAVLFAETDGLEEAHDEVNRQQPDPVVKGGQNDFLLDETEEISTSDILDSRLWEVWVRRENEVSHSQSKLHPTLLSLTAEPSERSQRVKLWNQVLPQSVAFNSTPDRAETQETLRVDPFLANTLSFGTKDTLFDIDEDLESEVPSETEADETSQMSTCGFQVLQYRVIHRPLKITRLSSLAHQARPNHEEQHDTRSTNQIVRTIDHKHLQGVYESIKPLLKLVEQLHLRDLSLGGFDPSLFGYDEELTDTVKPLYPLPLYDMSNAQPPISTCGEESMLHTGFSPPEVYGYFDARPTKRSDVFSAGMVLYYALTDCPRFPETRRPFFRLPSPFVYRQDLAPELVAVIYRAISPCPDRRQQNLSELIKDLEWALSSNLKRQKRPQEGLRLEAAHEIHIGLLKGQYNPINQDDLFLGYQNEIDLGLFVVTDGVSICEYGSGDLASGFVRETAVENWRDLCQLQTLTEDEDTLSEITLGMIEGVAGNYGKFLTQLVNDSNRRIGEYVNQQLPVFHGPPEGIMAATIVAAVINQGTATFTSVGDSRIYLVRDGYIVNLMYDEDLYTHLLQAKQSPTQAQQSPSASALIHCVGEFTKNEEQKLIPSRISPQLKELKLLPGDHLLLCSDGIPDYAGVNEEDAEEKMRKCVQDSYNIHHSAFELISLANRGGGGDNLSCIVLKFTSDFDEGDEREGQS